MCERVVASRAMTNSTFGRTGEDLAASFLERNGYLIVDRNVRWREGEIDLIVARAGVLAFVEVKSRRSRRYGVPAEAVTPAKQRRIRALAARYLSERRPIGARAIRFDVVEVARDPRGYQVRHLEDAF